jgi:hypothetical protein
MIKSTISHYDSSTLKSAAYNYEHKTLLVHFNHGSYLYKDVEATDWNLFNLAESQGKALNQFIKGKYEFEKIHNEETSLAEDLN